jgi:predicted DNA binding CopG/RHH family protein
MKKLETEKLTERIAIRISLQILTKLQFMAGLNYSEFIRKLIEQEYFRTTGEN